MEHTTPTSIEPFPVLDSAPTTSEHNHAAPVGDIVPAPLSPSLSRTETLFQVTYEGPLYTEINIPLPRIPRHYASHGSQPSTTPTASTASSPLATEKPRGRSVTLSSLSPFRTRRASSSATTSSSTSTAASRQSDDWPRIRKDVVKSREVNALMDLRHPSKRGRSGTIDALAVVPAVLVLSAELFTPGTAAEGERGPTRRKDSGVGRWEDGIR